MGGTSLKYLGLTGEQLVLVNEFAENLTFKIMECIYLENSVRKAVNVHALPIFTVLDHHNRRERGKDRVIGMLMGIVGSNGIVEVTDALCVYHEENMNIETEIEVINFSNTCVKDQLNLHHKVSPKEILVGWYSTETETTRNSQDWTIQVDQYFRGYARTYGKDLAPIHLLVDVSLRKPTVGITAHMLIPNDLLIRIGVMQSAQMQVNFIASLEERVGLDVMSRAAGLRDPTASTEAMPVGQPSEELEREFQRISLGDVRDLSADSKALEVSLKRLHTLIRLAARYCEDVASGARAGDESVGRALADTLSAVPPFDAEFFQRTFGRSVQDLLMVSYLSQLTQAQIKLAERISSLKQVYQGW